MVQGPVTSLYEAARAAGLSFTKEVIPQEKWTTSGQLRLHYLDWGTMGKPWLLLLHGAYQSCHAWDFFALSMCQEYHAISLDQRGHGDSDWAPSGKYTTEAHVADLKSFINALGMKSPIIVGNALGGINGMAFAATYPQVPKALVIVDIALEGGQEGIQNIRHFVTEPDELDSFEAFVERAHRFNPNRPKEQLRGSLQHSLKRLPSGKWTWKYDKYFRDPNRPQVQDPDWGQRMWDYARRVACPTLQVRGGASRVLTAEVAEKQRQAIPNSRLVTIEGAGHMAMGDKPVEFETAVRAFLNSL